MMMKTLLKITLALASIAIVSACGVGVATDHQYSDQNRKDAKALNDLFDVARGTYNGTFTPADKGVADQTGTLSLYVVSVREGANPDGTVRVRPALYGRFKLDGAVTPTDYLPMTGNYDELGNIDLSTVSATQSGVASSPVDAPTIEIRGVVAKDHASVEAINTGGPWGHFEGSRISADASAPSTGEAQDLRSRLIAIYTPIVGIYSGTVDTGVERARVQITVSINEGGAGGTGVSAPYLVGQYRRLDFPSGIGERQLAINYDSLSHTVSMTGVQGGGSVPGSSTFSGRGTWRNSVLNVDLTDSRGQTGNFTATRKPSRN